MAGLKAVYFATFTALSAHALPAAAEEQKAFTLTIEGRAYDVAPGQDLNVRLNSGAQVTIGFARKESAVYDNPYFSFTLPGGLSVAETDLGDGAYQYIAITALGTALILQSHKEVDTADLRDQVFEKLLDEPKAKGLAIERTEVSRDVGPGLTLKGIRGHYAEPSDDVTIDIFPLQQGKGGLLFITMHDQFTAPAERAMIDQFWKTLQVKPRP